MTDKARDEADRIMAMLALGDWRNSAIDTRNRDAIASALTAAYARGEADMRERAAGVADSYLGSGGEWDSCAIGIAENIRALKTEGEG